MVPTIWKPNTNCVWFSNDRCMQLSKKLQRPDKIIHLEIKFDFFWYSLREFSMARFIPRLIPTLFFNFTERGNSVEEDRSLGQTLIRVSPQPVPVSPSRQSSSSIELECPGTTVAKKKRELFSARSSRSGGSNKSSASEYSRDYSFSSKVNIIECLMKVLLIVNRHGLIREQSPSENPTVHIQMVIFLR
jgi:hypothetical protein